jgi:hypothetical protein
VFEPKFSTFLSMFWIHNYKLTCCFSKKDMIVSFKSVWNKCMLI